MNPVWIVRKKRLRAWARAHGVDVPAGLNVATPVCGDACHELIRRVERRAFGPEQISGVWSARLGALVKPQRSLQQRVVGVAQKEVGVKEHPANSNDGPRVREYQRTTGAYKAPWCASFVTWCFAQAGKRLEGFNTAYCPSWVEAAKAGRNSLRVVSRQEAKPGDCCLFDWQRDGTSDHIGILTSRVSADGDFTSVEGNTSYGNDSNGGQVMVRQRNARDVLVFVRVAP